MQTRLPACVITNGRRSSTGDVDGAGPGCALTAGLLTMGVVVGDGSFDFVCGVTFGSRARRSIASAVEGSGVTGTGCRTVGRKVSSFGANFVASSLVGNSIATKALGKSVRTGHAANIRRDWARASEFFFKNPMIDL